MARQGTPGHEVKRPAIFAWQGLARHGLARHGKAGAPGYELKRPQFSLGMVWQGKAGQGRARHGLLGKRLKGPQFSRRQPVIRGEKMPKILKYELPMAHRAFDLKKGEVLKVENDSGFYIRLPRDMKRRAQDYSCARGMSLSTWVRVMIAAALDATSGPRQHALPVAALIPPGHVVCPERGAGPGCSSCDNCRGVGYVAE